MLGSDSGRFLRVPGRVYGSSHPKRHRSQSLPSIFPSFSFFFPLFFNPKVLLLSSSSGTTLSFLHRHSRPLYTQKEPPFFSHLPFPTMKPEILGETMLPETKGTQIWRDSTTADL
ncbi:putative endo-1,4-beta-glucanase [Corchorus olitorius]|uniref:Endo-1,4-beta-glucanase n=1 Tax=Corchorus olitorius TaxID=93759 RepID=A0A1R3KFV5_9ROSI|nr:putative endo-1,4-beta-glucanase [Corchorus olitorius]